MWRAARPSGGCRWRAPRRPVGEQFVDLMADALFACPDPRERQVSTSGHSVNVGGVVGEYFRSEFLDRDPRASAAASRRRTTSSETFTLIVISKTYALCRHRCSLFLSTTQGRVVGHFPCALQPGDDEVEVIQPACPETSPTVHSAHQGIWCGFHCVIQRLWHTTEVRSSVVCLRMRIAELPSCAT